MNEMLKVVLSLSLSGSLLILVLLLCRPLFRNRMSQCWQYYLWLVVIARLLLPFTPDTSPVGTLFQGAGRAIVQTDTTISGQNTAPAPQPEDDTELKKETILQSGEPSTNTMPQQFLTVLLQNLWFVWLAAALLLLVRKITIYQGFVTYIKAGRAEVSDTALLDRLAFIGAQAGVKRPVELYTNSLISSPLLLGFFRPCIVLPTTEIAPMDFNYTILHELTHYKRRDMFYKWLLQLTICLHWFNPLVYVMGREVGRMCELACDEAVIQTLDAKGQRAYGDTLIHAVKTGGGYRDSIASVTLHESKDQLKERLCAIMSFQKKTRLAAILSTVFAFIFCFGAAAAGAYTSAAPNSKAHESLAGIHTDPMGAAIPPETGYVAVDFNGVILTGQGPVGVELVKSQNPTVAFERLNMDNEHDCTTKANIVNGTLEITINHSAPNGIQVSFGPDYQNVVRVYLPDAIYSQFDLYSTGMVVQMQDFHAPVHVESNRAGFWLIDDIISQGAYDIQVSSGPIYIEADTILKDITAHAGSGPITVRFRKAPANLYLDSANCGPVVERPNDWPAIYRVGSETPRILLSNVGKAVIDIPSKSKIETSTMESFYIGDTRYYQVENEAQLRSIGQGEYRLDQNYIQVADIQMSTNEWVPIGTKDHPFTGSYCGNGCEIIGLTMTDPDATIIGLFGVADGANIYNITMRDYDIETAGRNVTGKSVAPILVFGLGDTRSYDNQAYPKEK